MKRRQLRDALVDGGLILLDALLICAMICWAWSRLDRLGWVKLICLSGLPGWLKMILLGWF